jgi:hypothetical protein
MNSKRLLLLVGLFALIICGCGHKADKYLLNYVNKLNDDRTVRDSVFYLNNNPAKILIKTYDIKGRLFFKSYENTTTKRDSVIMFDESGKMISTNVFVH